MTEIKEFQCWECCNVYPLTTEYFQRDKHQKTGFMTRCKPCQTSRRREYLRTDKGKEVLKVSRQRRNARLGVKSKLDSQIERAELAAKGLKRCTNCLIVKQRNLNFTIDRNSPDGYTYWCKDCNTANHSNHKLWREQNPEKMAAARRRRYARKRGAVANFTKEDWQYALEYFHYCCAVCGRQMNDMFGEFKTAADHWIPLSKGGHTIPENMIPLCQGKKGCNNKKHDIMPQEWLERMFGKRKAKQILAKIEQFFTTVRKI